MRFCRGAKHDEDLLKRRPSSSLVINRLEADGKGQMGNASNGEGVAEHSSTHCRYSEGGGCYLYAAAVINS